MGWIANILKDELDGMTRDEAADWIDDLESHGCSSGMVGALIYYRDTRRVYDENESEIIRALDDVDYKDDTSSGLLDLDCIANARVWAAFELGARAAFEEMAFEDASDEDEDAPTVEIVRDGPAGPRVRYPAHMSAEDVEGELPYPWTVANDDWSLSVKLADGRMSAPLSRYDAGEDT